MHEKKVIHRDIKPLNIILRKGSYEPVIIDFGLAFHKELSTVAKSQVAGTPAYMSPEQISVKLLMKERRSIC